jgi:hypothetical protein
LGASAASQPLVFDRLFDVPVTGLRKEQPMLDAILLAFGFGFFALSIAYAYGCDRL